MERMPEMTEEERQELIEAAKRHEAKQKKRGKGPRTVRPDGVGDHYFGIDEEPSVKR
jgi:hypothetical protein